ncbi:MAG: hypothetical protein WD689_07175 [Gaiellaceae bacterium]
MKSVATTWALYAVFALLTFVTYSRLDGLYNVSREGIAGGASRTLVYLNFPVAFAAIGILLLLRGRVAAVGIALCAVAAVPGVLDLDDLDARPVNAVPALGVAVAAALTVIRRDRLRASNTVLLGDPVRVGLAVVLALIAVPWLFAEAGFYAPDPIYSEEIAPGETIAAVHLGGHHGTYGVLLALSALLLSRTRHTALASSYFALMLAYGGALAAEDFWHEQVVKRGSVDWTIPSLIQPELEWGWLAILVAAAAVYLLWFRRERTRR